MIRIFQWAVEQRIVSEEINKPKRARLRVTVRDPSRKVNSLSKVVYRVCQVYQFCQNRLASPCDGYLSLDYISRWVD